MDFVDSSFYMTNSINVGYNSLNNTCNNSETGSSTFYENLWTGEMYETNARIVSLAPNGSSFYVGYC